jgi:hypothetical protein
MQPVCVQLAYLLPASRHAACLSTACLSAACQPASSLPASSLPAWREFMQSQEFFLLTTIVDSPLLGQSASGLNIYDGGGRSPLAD